MHTHIDCQLIGSTIVPFIDKIQKRKFKDAYNLSYSLFLNIKKEEEKKRFFFFASFALYGVF